MGDKGLKRSVVAAVALACFAVSCSGGGDDTLPPLEPIETSSSTTEATTTVPTTEPTTTAEETTTVVEDDAAARPELDPDNWETDLDEIFGRYLLYWEAADVAYGPPAADPDYAPLADLMGPEALTDLRAELASYRDAGQIFVIADDSLNDHGVRLPKVDVSLAKNEGNEVIIQDCYVADDTLQTVDGDVVESSFFPSLLNVTMQVIEGEWRVFAIVDASPDSEGWDECNEHFANLER